MEFRVAVIVWILSFHYWITGPWWDQVLSVMPNVLGFTLGGFAIFLGFGDERFKNMLAGNEGGSKNASPYMSVAAAFVIFVAGQLFAIFYAISAKALHFETPKFLASFSSVIAVGDFVFSAVGYFIFLLSLMLAMRATLRVFRLARWYDRFVSDLKASDAAARELQAKHADGGEAASGKERIGEIRERLASRRRYGRRR